MTWARIDTDFGTFHARSDGAVVTDILLPTSRRVLDGPATARPTDPVLRDAAKQIKDYCARRRDDLTFPIRQAGTPFQQAVWDALRAIPRGETRSYGDIAAAIGKPGAARAVGNANNRNHLPLVVPCHRVIAADGGLGGYDGGELLKMELLRLEGAWPADA